MSNSKSKTDLSAAFATLRRRFEDGLPERSLKMLQNIEQEANINLAAVIAEAHKLAGACGTFGHAALGSHARQIEQLATEINSKTDEDRLQALPGLRDVLVEFDIAVNKTLHEAEGVEAETLTKLHQSDTVWLLLPSDTLAEEITRLLQAFGHKVECFTDFISCLTRLQSAAPAVFFSAINVGNSA